MAARPKSLIRGVTPGRVVKLLNEEVKRTSQISTAKRIGITQSCVNKYLSGDSEPTTSTLRKIADFFGAAVQWLRGDPGEPLPTLTGLLQEKLKSNNLLEISGAVGISTTILNEFVKGEDRPDDSMLNRLADYLNVSEGYLLGEPHEYTIRGSGDFGEDIESIKYKVGDKDYELTASDITRIIISFLSCRASGNFEEVENIMKGIESRKGY